VAGGGTIPRRRDVSPLLAGITLHRQSPTPRRRHATARSRRTFTRRPPVCSRAAEITSLPWSAVPLAVASTALAEQIGALFGGGCVARRSHWPNSNR
jgi:hypothetical protein